MVDLTIQKQKNNFFQNCFHVLMFLCFHAYTYLPTNFFIDRMGEESARLSKNARADPTPLKLLQMDLQQRYSRPLRE